MRPRGTGSLYKPKHSRFWHARVSGQWRTTGKETRQEAEIVLAGWIKDANEHDGQLFTPTQQTVAELMRAYQADTALRGKACRGLGSIIGTVAKTALGMRKARTARTEHFATFANDKLADGKSRDYVALMLRYIRAAFHYAQRINALRTIPHITMLGDLRRREDSYSEAEVGAILPQVPQPYADAALWLYETAWRPIEVVRIRRDEIQLETAIPVVRMPKSKTGPRALPLEGVLLDIVRRRLADAVPGNPYLFPSKHSSTKHINASTVARKWQAASTALGVTGKTLYGLKRTTVSDLSQITDTKTGMSITGQKTEPIYHSYDIMQLGRMQHALRTLQSKRGTISLPHDDESQNCLSLRNTMRLCAELQPTVRVLPV